MLTRREFLRTSALARRRRDPWGQVSWGFICSPPSLLRTPPFHRE